MRIDLDRAVLPRSVNVPTALLAGPGLARKSEQANCPHGRGDPGEGPAMVLK